LDGLEACVAETITEKRRHKINVVRYADDFIITGDSREWLENQVKPRVIRFLAERGLRLSEEKTHITHIEKGFDFLGWHIRKYPNGKLLTKPSDKSIQTLSEKTGEIIRNNRQTKTVNVIKQLNPIIRGWANYHRHAAAKRVFQQVDTFVFQQLWHWAKRRHPRKTAHWVREKYFKTVGGNHWVFTGVDDKGNQLHLFKASYVPVTRHVKIKGKANPFDPEWENYFEQRYLQKWKNQKRGRSRLRYLWEKQGGICPMCGQRFGKETSIHTHHIVERCKGGGDHLGNLVLLHPNCHRQVHYLMNLGKDMRFLSVCPSD
jgi:RNA-directed DNA polymerase